MNRRLIGFALAMALLSSGCSLISPSAPPVSARVPQATWSSSPTSTPSATPSLSSVTPRPTLSPTPTPFKTPEPTQSATPDIQSLCLTLEPELPEDVGVEGKLILYTKDYSLELTGKEEVYLFDPKTQEKLLISPSEDGLIKSYDLMAVSPDGRWFAYNETIPELIENGKYVRLQIVSSDGTQLPLPVQAKEWGQIIGWLDNERLVLTLWDDNIGWERYDGAAMMLNPFSGQSQVLLPSFPMPSNSGASWYDAGLNPIVIYDPTLTKVAYLAGAPDGSYALWDIPSQQFLWELPTIFYDNTRPVWSPDGMYLAVAGGVLTQTESPTVSASNLYIVTRDGQEIRITNGVSGFLSWSPDGQYLAFWDELRRSLALLEVQPKLVTVYCIEPSLLVQTPIWSPDGRWIAVNANVPDAATGVVIIDTIQHRAFEIAKDVRVRGWMAEPAIEHTPTVTPTP